MSSFGWWSNLFQSESSQIRDKVGGQEQGRNRLVALQQDGNSAANFDPSTRTVPSLAPPNSGTSPTESEEEYSSQLSIPKKVIIRDRDSGIEEEAMVHFVFSDDIVPLSFEESCVAFLDFSLKGIPLLSRKDDSSREEEAVYQETLSLCRRAVSGGPFDQVQIQSVLYNREERTSVLVGSFPENCKK